MGFLRPDDVFPYLGGGSGLGKLDPTIAPPGQHSNAELPGKLAQAKQADAKLSSLITSLTGALTQNQALLLSVPSTAGLVSVAQQAIADLQNAQSNLEASFWNGQNFNTFQAGTDAWNLMDVGTTAALQKVQAYSGLANQLAGAVAQAQSAQQQAQAQAQQQAQAQAATVAQAQAQVTSAILQANGLVASNPSGALALLSDPSTVSAAQTAGMTTQLQNAVNSINVQQAQIANQQAQAAQNAALLQQQQAAAAAAAQAQADAAQHQADLDFQLKQQQLQEEADRQNAMLQAQQQQAILNALPIFAQAFGPQAAAAILAQNLGVDVSQVGHPGSPFGGASDFGRETSF